MGRAVARQCQMDPKVYLPLLESLERRGRGQAVTSYAYADMRVAANVYLERSQEVVHWAARAVHRALPLPPPSSDLSLSHNAASDPVSDTKVDSAEVQDMCNLLSEHIYAGDSYLQSLPFLVGLLNECKARLQGATGSSSDSSSAKGRCQQIIDIVSKTLNDVRVCYGDYISSSRYLNNTPGMNLDLAVEQAVSAYMAVEPPAVVKAIAASRKAGHWQTALSLAARHAKYLQTLGPSAANLTPRKIAAEVVEELMASLEQADAMADDTWGGSAASAIVGDNAAGAGSARDGGSGVIDKITQAAQMSVDYLQDVEGAARILLMAQRYSQAAQLVLRYDRNDILLDDVATTVTEAAEQLTRELQSKAVRVVHLSEQLRTGPWADVDARLKAAQEAEPLLRKEVEWLDAGGEDQVNNEDLNNNNNNPSDTRSDFSAANSMRSDQSFVSNMTSMSGTSCTSGASTVSVLSDLQTGAEKEQSQKRKNLGSGGSTFSIAGLDHTLLSRGSGKEDRVPMTPKVRIYIYIYMYVCVCVCVPLTHLLPLQY